jgi:chromosome segregation ATPase
MLNHLKYVIQFQLSAQIQHGVKFILSRILENLHAAEAATYYKVIGETQPAEELTDLGKLALATAYASEAQIFSRQSEQWAFRAQVARASAFKKLEDEISQFEDEEGIDSTLRIHDDTITRIRQTVASFEAATNELNSVKGEAIRRKNNVDQQVKQLQAVVLKFKGDLSRILGAKSDFLAEFSSKKGDASKAMVYYSEATDRLREAVGNYTVAAQVFQQMGDAQAAQTVDNRAKTTDLVARGVWDNRQKLDSDQAPAYMGDSELTALYLGTGGQ